MSVVGVSNCLVFAIWIPISYFVVRGFQDKALGYGMALLGYEIASLTANIFIALKHAHKDSLNAKESIWDGFGYFLWFSFKIGVGGFLMNILLDLMTVMLQQTGDKV